MNKKNFYFIGLFVFIWLLAGCKTGQHLQMTGAAHEQPPFTVNAPAIEPLDEQEVPDDIQMVTAAIIAKLRQVDSGIDNISFNPSGSHYTPESRFEYDGFSVTSINILHHSAEQATVQSYSCELAGTMMFQDELGRRALVSYDVNYTLFQDRVVVDSSLIRPVPPIFPNAQAFIIESSKMRNIVRQRLNYENFYAQVVTNSVNMTPTPEEVKLHRELQELSFFQRLQRTPSNVKQDYFMVIFVKDRLTPDALIEVVVSENIHDRRSVLGPSYHDFDGWRVAMFQGNFAIDGDMFYAKTYYRPAQEILPDGADQVLIAIFTPEKKYDKPEPQKMQTAVRPAEGTQTQTPAEGPIASGKKLLNPANRDDARVIQTRLAELGFYSMAIDGLWGPGSRGALQGFQRANYIAANGEWTMQSQMSLFNGTGK